MSLGRIKPKYVSLSTVNDNNDSSATINATIEENYRDIIIPRAGDLVCAIERMEISLNGIPFYKRVKTEHNDRAGGYETILCYNRNDPNNTSFIVPIYTATQFNDGTYVRDFYNLKEILDQLSTIIFPVILANGTEDLVATYTCQFTMDEKGYIRYSANQINFGTGLGPQRVYFTGSGLAGTGQPNGNDLDQKIVFPQYLNMILGLGERKGLTVNEIVSDYPRFDLGDELAHILLGTSLPVISDSIGQELQQVLTDFAPSSTYGGQYTINGFNLQATSLTLNSRQKLIYVPAEKRYLDLTSDFNVRDIRIDAYYVTNWGTYLRVPLPIGGMFQVKLGFYHK